MGFSAKKTMTEEQIVNFYQGCKSIRETSRYFNLSTQKIRRILICCGIYRTELSDKVVALFEAGMDYNEIAKLLHVSKSTVYAYVPYTKGRYYTDNPTENAIRIRKCKAKKKKKEADN